MCILFEHNLPALFSIKTAKGIPKRMILGSLNTCDFPVLPKKPGYVLAVFDIPVLL